MTERSRHLAWEGCFNARDLGGLPTNDGRWTRWGAVVRADSLDGLTDLGWKALIEHGVRTVIDLRNDDELGERTVERPSSVRTVRLPLDVAEDREFWTSWASGPQFGTPLYYRPHLERFPERSAAVVAAIAGAAPGGVAFHCGGGRDRAGQISILVLALVGVRAEHVAADYGLSFDRLAARHAALGENDQGPLVRSFLRERGTTAENLIVELLGEVDVEAHLRRAGLTEHDVRALRARLVGQDPTP